MTMTAEMILEPPWIVLKPPSSGSAILAKERGMDIKGTLGGKKQKQPDRR